MQNKVIEEQQLAIGKRIQTVTITEVLNAITNMKSGKARDENGIGAEHYKYDLSKSNSVINLGLPISGNGASIVLGCPLLL
jgi:hypothetical protein